jgi:hypothetical protein
VVLGDVTASVVEGEASDGGMNCRRETEDLVNFL